MYSGPAGVLCPISSGERLRLHIFIPSALRPKQAVNNARRYVTGTITKPSAQAHSLTAALSALAVTGLWGQALALLEVLCLAGPGFRV